MNTVEYEELLPDHNRSRNRFREFFNACLRQGCDIGSFLERFTYWFDLDHAEGAQLDMLGEAVGAYRTLDFQPASGPSTLDDRVYRFYIRAKIIKSVWDGSADMLTRILNTFFSDMGASVIDHQDMSVTFILRGDFDDIQKEMINAGLIMPLAAGVSAEYVYPRTVADTDVFVNTGAMETGHTRLMQGASRAKE